MIIVLLFTYLGKLKLMDCEDTQTDKSPIHKTAETIYIFMFYPLRQALTLWIRDMFGGNIAW